MNTNRYLYLILLLFYLSCTTKENNRTQAKSDSTASAATQMDTSMSATDDPIGSDEEIQELGLLKEVEDTGYPMASLTIEFPERKFTEYFSINLEAVKGADINKLRAWVGKYVSFRYTSRLTNTLLDVQSDGKSVLGADAPEIKPAMKKIEGVLKGADEETPGDLPGKVSITSADNNTLTFAFFVTKEMVEVNGKKVVGYYEERPENVIKAIKLSK